MRNFSIIAPIMKVYLRNENVASMRKETSFASRKNHAPNK